MRKKKLFRQLDTKIIATLQPEKFIWKTMDRRELRWLALAVGLAFATFGPLITLMRTDLTGISWLFFAITTASSGLMAATILLYGYRVRNIILIVTVFTVTIVGAGMLTPKAAPDADSAGESNEFSGPGDRQETQRKVVAIVGFICIAASYGVFLQVVSKGLRAKGALEAEISIAQSIQRSLLPSGTVKTAWCEIAGVTVPAADVGGDYFDIVRLDEERVLVAIGDVSGHGVGAGILAAMAKSALYSQLESHKSIVDAMEILNKTIFAVTDRKTFITFCLLFLDHKAGTAQLVSAGHPPVLYKKADSAKAQPLRTPNLGIGMRHETRFRHLELPLEAGSSFFLYTDGFFEATDQHGEEFGEARLRTFFEKERAPSAERFCQDAIELIREFTSENRMQDDTTMVAVRITA